MNTEQNNEYKIIQFPQDQKATLKNEEVTEFSIPPGAPFIIKNNVPVRLKIETIGGTLIEGVLPPNNSLRITPGDDILRCNCYIEDELLSKPSLLK